MGERLPLATIHGAILEFLRDRKDVALFGAQAVNAYVPHARMTQDVDILALGGEKLPGELREFLSGKFHIAVRVRRVAGKKGFRLYQVQKGGNRHLVDIRSVEVLPETEIVHGVQVIAPAELVADKVNAYHLRRQQPKAGTDWRDIAMLLLEYPQLKQPTGEVTKILKARRVSPEVIDAWLEFVQREIRPEDDDGGF